MIQFTVYGTPVAQGRARVSTFGGHVRLYDPAKSSDYKQYVKQVAADHAPAALLEGAIGIMVTAYRPTPKSFSHKKAAAAEEGKILPISKPDADNYLKAVKDALKGVIWRDDSQVVEALVRKRYSARPRIEVKIKDLST